MNKLKSRITAWCSRSIVFSVLFASTAATAQEVYVCVWRNPERTMTRLFPEARDYRTVTVPIPTGTLARIEKRTGSALLPGQREQYQYFEMIGTNGTVIGHTHAMTQKGEFGAIEFVFGTDPQHRITAIYIQRQRERDRGFREESFLEKFKGLTPGAADTFTDPLSEKGSAGSRTVTLGVREALIEFDELVLTKK
jgi:hypothetical protein